MRLSVVLIPYAALIPDTVIAVASVIYALRRRSGASTLLAVGAAGLLFLDLANVVFSSFIGRFAFQLRPELLTFVIRWEPPVVVLWRLGFGLLFAIALLLVLLKASAAQVGRRTEPDQDGTPRIEQST